MADIRNWRTFNKETNKAANISIGKNISQYPKTIGDTPLIETGNINTPQNLRVYSDGISASMVINLAFQIIKGTIPNTNKHFPVFEY